jgi:hypothetical protein
MADGLQRKTEVFALLRLTQNALRIPRSFRS